MVFPHRKNETGWCRKLLQQGEILYCLFCSDFSEKYRESKLIIRGHRDERVLFLEREKKLEASSTHFLLDIWGVQHPLIFLSSYLTPNLFFLLLSLNLHYCLE